MNYCPNPGKYNKNQLNKDLQDFTRRIKLKSYFHTQNQDDQPNNNNNNNSLIFKNREKSNWTPKDIHHTVKTFCDAVIHETTIAENRKTNNKSNLSKEEKQALLDLQERDDIIITNADKGGAVVIQDVKEYIKEGNRQLNNSDFYKKVDKDLTHTHQKLVNNTLDNLQKENLLTEKIAKSLKAHNSSN